MGLFENFPYANFHELNLDWILHELKALETEITNFVAINSVKYANPITWDITSQYETNTVVLDSSGNAYLSVQPVPAGVALDREEYWTKIGNFSALWDSVRSAITPYDEQHSTTASVDHNVGDWVWLENDLVIITKNITAGDKYVEGSNCEKTNLHDLFVTLSNELSDKLKNKNVVFFEDYGAVGDGLTDDTKAIKDAISAAENGNKSIVATKTYKVSDTIEVNSAKIKKFECTGLIISELTDRPIIVFNDGFESEITCHVEGSIYNGNYNYPAENENYNFPDNLANVGIVLNNTSRSIIKVSAKRCNVGVKLTGTTDTTGVVFNTIFVDAIYDCVIGIDMIPEPACWVNSNVFINGGFQNSSANAYASRNIGVRMKSHNYTINGNTFISPSFEMRGMPWLIDNGDLNKMLDVRNENGTDNTVKVVRGQFNEFNAAYGVSGNIIGDNAGKNRATSAYSELNRSEVAFSWHYDRNNSFMFGGSNLADTFDYINDCDLHDLTNITPKADRPVHYDGVELNDNSVSLFGKVIGCWIKADRLKKICVACDGTNSRGVFAFANANGEKVTTANRLIGYSFRDVITRENYVDTDVLSVGSKATFNVNDLSGVSEIFVGVYGSNISWFTVETVRSDDGLETGATSPGYTKQKYPGCASVKYPTITSKCNVGTFVPACDTTEYTDSTGTYYKTGYICTAENTWVAVKSYKI